MLLYNRSQFFFLNFVFRCNVTKEDINVELKGNSEFGSCRIWTQILDRRDGSFIVRYKMMQTCDDLEIHVTAKGLHIGKSPYKFKGRIYAETCECPIENLDEMIQKYKCSENINQINQDLDRFKSVDFSQVLKEGVTRFDHAGSYSFCHYAIKNNQANTSLNLFKRSY